MPDTCLPNLTESNGLISKKMDLSATGRLALWTKSRLIDCRSVSAGNKKSINRLPVDKALVCVTSVKDPSSRLDRCRLKLEEFDSGIINRIYKPGKRNSNADALSRDLAPSTPPIDNERPRRMPLSPKNQVP